MRLYEMLWDGTEWNGMGLYDMGCYYMVCDGIQSYDMEWDGIGMAWNGTGL